MYNLSSLKYANCIKSEVLWRMRGLNNKVKSVIVENRQMKV